MWVLAIFVGSLILSMLWFYERTSDLSFRLWVTRMLPITITCELAYWYGFRKAPSFIQARYVMSAMTHVFAWVLALWILHEGITWQAGIGCVLIIAGAILIGK